MKPSDPCLFDSSIWILGQNDPHWFSALVITLPDVATCLAAVGEYAVGLYSPRKKTTRDQVREFLEDKMAAVAWHGHLPDDFSSASRLIGDAIFRSVGQRVSPVGRSGRKWESRKQKAEIVALRSERSFAAIRFRSLAALSRRRSGSDLNSPDNNCSEFETQRHRGSRKGRKGKPTEKGLGEKVGSAFLCENLCVLPACRQAGALKLNRPEFYPQETSRNL